MSLQTVQNIPYSHSPSPSISIVYPVGGLPDIIRIYSTTPSLGTTGSITLSNASTPPPGSSWKVIIIPSVNVSGLTVTLFGVSVVMSVTTEGGSLFNQSYVYDFWIDDSSTLQYVQSPQSYNGTDAINGATIMDNSIASTKIANSTTPGNLLIADSSNQWIDKTVTGDVFISNDGVTSIQPSVIINAQISGTAAITRSKLATGNANYVVIEDGSGNLSDEAQLSPLRGGLGINASASTGFVKFNSGTVSIGSIYEVIVTDVEFTNPPSGISTNKIKIPYSGTITDIYAIVMYTIAGTDSATITPKNNAGTNMTLSSPLSFSANSAVDTAIDTAVTANNIIAAGDILSFTTSKPTPGGKVKLSITITRTS